jgi:hypothetical protein
MRMSTRTARPLKIMWFMIPAASRPLHRTSKQFVRPREHDAGEGERAGERAHLVGVKHGEDR